MPLKIYGVLGIFNHALSLLGPQAWHTLRSTLKSLVHADSDADRLHARSQAPCHAFPHASFTLNFRKTICQWDGGEQHAVNLSSCPVKSSTAVAEPLVEWSRVIQPLRRTVVGGSRKATAFNHKSHVANHKIGNSKLPSNKKAAKLIKYHNTDTVAVSCLILLRSHRAT